MVWGSFQGGSLEDPLLFDITRPNFRPRIGPLRFVCCCFVCVCVFFFCFCLFFSLKDAGLNAALARLGLRRVGSFSAAQLGVFCAALARLPSEGREAFLRLGLRSGAVRFLSAGQVGGPPFLFLGWHPVGDWSKKKAGREEHQSLGVGGAESAGLSRVGTLFWRGVGLGESSRVAGGARFFLAAQMGGSSFLGGQPLKGKARGAPVFFFFWGGGGGSRKEDRHMWTVSCLA